MEILNNITKIYFYEFLYRNNPFLAFKLLKLDRNGNDYFYTAATRYRKINQPPLKDKFIFYKQLIELDQNNSWSNLNSKQSRDILAQAAKYDIIYPFIKIHPDLVDDVYNPLRFALEDDRIRPGYLFQKGALLNIAAYYDSFNVAKYLLQNNNYTVNGQMYDFYNNPEDMNEINLNYPNYIRNNFIDLVYKNDDFITPLFNSFGGNQVSALDIAARRNNLDIVRLLTQDNNLENWKSQALIYAGIDKYDDVNININVVNYLLEHNFPLINNNFGYVSAIRWLVQNNYSMAEYIINYIINNNIRFYLDNIENNRKIISYLDGNITKNSLFGLGYRAEQNIKIGILLNKFKNYFKH